MQFVYWPVTLVLAYVAIAAFYIRRSRARGIETRVRPYAIKQARPPSPIEIAQLKLLISRIDSVGTLPDQVR